MTALLQHMKTRNQQTKKARPATIGRIVQDQAGNYIYRIPSSYAVRLSKVKRNDLRFPYKD